MAEPISMGETIRSAQRPDDALGHTGPRAAILVRLKRESRLTVKDVARELGLSSNAARHHLKELQAKGLIEFERAPRGVGAPPFTYRLSATGEALFPRRYEATLTALLDQVVEQAGRDTAVALLQAQFDGLARRLEGELAGTSPEERLEAVGRTLSEEGYMAEVSARAGDAVVTEHNCAIPAVAERFPEVCAAEAQFLAEVLRAEVSRREHILSGCSACEYHVRFKPVQEST